MIGEDPITGGIGWTVDGELSTLAVRIEHIISDLSDVETKMPDLSSDRARASRR